MNELTFRNGDTYLSYSEIYEGLSFYLKNEIDVNIFDLDITNLVCNENSNMEC